MLEGWLFCGSQCCLPPGRSRRALLQHCLQVMMHGYHYIRSTIFSLAPNQEHLILWSLKNDSFHNQRLSNVFRPMLLHAPLTHLYIINLHCTLMYIYREREREPSKILWPSILEGGKCFRSLSQKSVGDKDFENICALRVWCLVPQTPLVDRWLFRESSVSDQRSCCFNAMPECFFAATQIEDVIKIRIKNSLASAISSHGLLHLHLFIVWKYTR